jgi:hypothetical protein
MAGWSFGGLRTLQTLDLPPSLREIAPCAFISLVSLTAITLPPELEVIEEMAFAQCAKFTGQLVISPSVKLIGKKAFHHTPAQLVFLPDCAIDVQLDSFPCSKCIGVPAKCEGHFGQILVARINNQCPALPTRQERVSMAVTIVILVLLTGCLRTGLGLCKTASGRANVKATPMVPTRQRT